MPEDGVGSYILPPSPKKMHVGKAVSPSPPSYPAHGTIKDGPVHSVTSLSSACNSAFQCITPGTAVVPFPRSYGVKLFWYVITDSRGIFVSYQSCSASAPHTALTVSGGAWAADTQCRSSLRPSREGAGIRRTLNSRSELSGHSPLRQT